MTLKSQGKCAKRLKFRLELAKSLHIKEKPSDLNTEVASVPLKLFNLNSVLQCSRL